MVFDPQMGAKKDALVGPCEASRTLEDLIGALAPHIACRFSRGE